MIMSDTDLAERCELLEGSHPTGSLLRSIYAACSWPLSQLSAMGCTLMSNLMMLLVCLHKNAVVTIH